MSGTRQAVQKVITAANSLTVNGKMQPEQAERFLDYVFDETSLKGFARLVRFTAEKMLIDKIGIGRRAAVPKAQAKDPMVRRRINTSQIELQPVEIMVPIEIGDIFTEINLEGKSVTTHIIQMFAKQLANDIEELHLHGNKIGPVVLESDYLDGGSSSLYIEDAYLKLIDGFLVKAQTGTNIVDWGNQPIGAPMWRKMLSAMPTKFKKNKGDLRWLVSSTIEEMWREKVSNRATQAGDQALGGQNVPTPFGIPMFPMPLLEHYPRYTESKTFTGSGSTISLGHAPINQDDPPIVIDSATVGNVPRAAYVEDVDYTVNYANGTITHIPAGSGGNIGNTDTVRVTYRANPQILLTHKNNLILAVSRDIRMEQDRDIYAGTDQFAITTKIDSQFEEKTAVVFCKNISDVV